MEEVKCPKCGSKQLSANKKGFSGKKAAAGALLTGGVGLLAGTIGSGKVEITCINCGNQWEAGNPPKEVSSKRKEGDVSPLAFLIGLVFVIAVVVFFATR